MVLPQKITFPVFLFMVLIVLAACNVAVKEVVSDSPIGNILTNPDFEEVDEGVAVEWGVGMSGSGDKPAWGDQVTATSEAARTGEIGIKIDKGSGGSYYIRQVGVPVEGGKTYELSVWQKSNTTPSNAIGMGAEFYTADGKYITASHGRAAPTADWSQVSYVFDTPEDAARATVFLRLYPNGWVYFDDASLELVEK